MAQVIVSQGEVNGEIVTDLSFNTKDSTGEIKSNSKGHFLIARNDGQFAGQGKYVRVRVAGPSVVKYQGESVTDIIEFKQAAKPAETDEQAMDRIKQQFDVLDEMSKACIAGDIRAMIVSGPPGVGKSFGVETQLDKASLFDKLSNKKVRFEIVKGAMTALGLYAQLYKFSDAKNVLVFDDCDSVLMDDLALNILKAALDSGKRRRIFWNSDSSMLRREGIPDSFEFKGSAIFITNLKFENLKSKKLQDHLEALQSRCHYLDLTINDERDKMLRIRQVHRDADGGLFRDYDFTPEQADTVLNFVDANKNKLRELSLRMCLKVADLVKISPQNWQNLARSTCMRG